MAQSFKCPNCNASLDFHRGDQPVIRCAYCNSSVLVPEELRGSVGDAGHLTGQAVRLHEIEQLIRSGRKIEAVARYRQTFESSLREAKKAVDGMEAGQSVLVSTDGDRTTSSGWLGCLILLALMIAFILFVAGSSLAPWLREANIPVISDALVDLRTGQEREEQLADVTLPTPRPLPSPVPSPSPTAEPDFATAVMVFGKGPGSGPGFFEDGRQIAVDNDGHIFIGEYATGRVQVFDEDGQFVTQWIVPGEPYMRGMAAGRDGVIYIAAGGQLNRYDGLTGDLIGDVTYTGGPGFDDVVVTADGGLAAFWYLSRDDIVRFDRERQVSLVIPEAVGAQSGDPELNLRIAVDSLGNIYALSNYSDFVYMFAADGRYVNRFGGKGDEPGQLQSPLAVAVDGQGRVYVADFAGIQVFDGDGRYIDTIEQRGAIFSMTFNDANELLVLERNGGQVVKYAINEG